MGLYENHDSHSTMSPRALETLVHQAQTMVSQRLLTAPNYGVYTHARDQLQTIATLIDNSLSPTDIQKNEIDIGLMAVKELESTDPELADILCRVDYEFEKLA